MNRSASLFAQSPSYQPRGKNKYADIKVLGFIIFYELLEAANSAAGYLNTSATVLYIFILEE